MTQTPVIAAFREGVSTSEQEPPEPVSSTRAATPNGASPSLRGERVTAPI